MCDDLLTAENQVLDLLLAGDHPDLDVLREQRVRSIVVGRENTGVGFFTRLVVPGNEPRLVPRRRIVFGDVYATTEECNSGCGFLLFVQDGLLDVLECYSCDEALPERPTFNRFYYGVKRDGSSVVESQDRDFQAVFQLLSAGYRESSNA